MENLKNLTKAELIEMAEELLKTNEFYKKTIKESNGLIRGKEFIHDMKIKEMNREIESVVRYLSN